MRCKITFLGKNKRNNSGDTRVPRGYNKKDGPSNKVTGKTDEMSRVKE